MHKLLLALIFFCLTLKAMDIEHTLLKQVATLEGHTDEIFTLLASQKNNKLLYSASSDKTIKQWYTQDYECLDTFEGHTGYIRGLTFGNQDEETIISSAWDETVRKWNIETADEIRIQRNIDDTISCLDQHNGTLVGGGKNIYVLNPETLAALLTFGSDEYHSICTYNKNIYAGTHSGTIEQWDLRKAYEKVATYEGEDQEQIDGIAFSPRTKRLYGCGPNSKKITICDTQNKKVLFSLDRSQKPSWFEGTSWNGYKSFIANVGLDDERSLLYAIHAGGILEVLNTQQIEKKDEEPNVLAIGTTPFDDPNRFAPFFQLEALAIDADDKQAYTAGSAAKLDGSSKDQIQVWDISKLINIVFLDS